MELPADYALHLALGYDWLNVLYNVFRVFADHNTHPCPSNSLESYCGLQDGCII